jgi:hypothetical protein
MTEGKRNTLSRVSTTSKLSRLTHDVEGLNKNYKDENERIKRILQMLRAIHRQSLSNLTTENHVRLLIYTRLAYGN